MVGTNIVLVFNTDRFHHIEENPEEFISNLKGMVNSGGGINMWEEELFQQGVSYAGVLHTEEEEHGEQGAGVLRVHLL